MQLVGKMDQLEKLWSELGRGAELKEQLLTDALGKAKRYGRTSQHDSSLR